MLGYEMKKLFNGRRAIVLLILVGLFILYFTYRLSISGSFEVSEAFDDYRSVISFYEVVMFIIATVFIAYLFPYEEQHNMSQLIKTSPARDKIVLCKIVLALLITNILSILSIVTSIISYIIAFQGDFHMDLYAYAADYTKNPDITNAGQVLCLVLITYFIAMNLNAMLVIWLSVKKSNPFFVCVLLPIVFTACITLGAITEIPVINTILNITPYNCVGDYESVEVLFQIGILDVTPYMLNITPYMLEWIVYIIGFIVLLKYLMKVYKAS